MISDNAVSLPTCGTQYTTSIFGHYFSIIRWTVSSRSIINRMILHLMLSA